MLGLDVRTDEEKASDAIRGIDTSTVQGLLKAANAIGEIPSFQPQALGLRQAAAELATQNRQDELREQQIASERLSQNLTRLEIDKAKEQNVTDIGNFTWTEDGKVKFGRGGILNNQVVIWDGQKYVPAPAGAVEVTQRGSSSSSDLSDELSDLINEYETTAITANQELQSLGKFLNDFDKIERTPGFPGRLERGVKEFFGTQDEENQITQRLNAIVNKRAIENLPKGAASDSDIALVLAGEINAETATEEQVRAYVNLARVIEAQNVLINEEKSRFVKASKSTSGLSEHIRLFQDTQGGTKISKLEEKMMSVYPYLFENVQQTQRSEAAQAARDSLSPNNDQLLDQGVQQTVDFIRGINRQAPRQSPIDVSTAGVLSTTRNPMLR